MTPDAPAGKVCRSCSETKPPAAFLPSALHDGGLTERCRACILARARQDREDRERRKGERQQERHQLPGRP